MRDLSWLRGLALAVAWGLIGVAADDDDGGDIVEVIQYSGGMAFKGE